MKIILMYSKFIRDQSIKFSRDFIQKILLKSQFFRRSINDQKKLRDFLKNSRKMLRILRDNLHFYIINFMY
jgi:hypothetical protein